MGGLHNIGEYILIALESLGPCNGVGELVEVGDEVGDEVGGEVEVWMCLCKIYNIINTINTNITKNTI